MVSSISSSSDYSARTDGSDLIPSSTDSIYRSAISFFYLKSVMTVDSFLLPFGRPLPFFVPISGVFVFDLFFALFSFAVCFYIYFYLRFSEILLDDSLFKIALLLLAG